jgi:triacylglycerol lipase
MKSFNKSLLLLLFVFGLKPVIASADIAVLVHGYHSSAMAWERSGVSSMLQENDWPRAGLYTTAGQGVRYLPAAGEQATNKVFVVDLPSEAPLNLQADLLQQILLDIGTRYPEEPITLVGHSAGGVVARIIVVRNTIPSVQRLVAIASPNLGTERVIQALDATDIPWPFNYIADFFGGDAYHTVRRSGHLLVDLLPATPGTYLGWLNVQPHPEIEYISMVRGQAHNLGGDWLVPGISQDLNNVPALSGRAALLTVPANHELTLLDGATLVSILN